jgi:hypothetical protein
MGWQLPTEAYSPNWHNNYLGFEKEKAVPWKSFYMRHLSYSILINSLVAKDAVAPLKTTPFMCLQMHQKIRLIVVHMFCLCSLRHELDDHSPPTRCQHPGAIQLCPRSGAPSSKPNEPPRIPTEGASRSPVPSHKADMPPDTADLFGIACPSSSTGSTSRPAKRRTCRC